ncbi:MAG: tRNA-(ms[2]io[6]A)-hydroxylase [Myxococcales bacterium]|nr:tRNA-(ms[2]io[6]A)-hydroxylase [Myxococcales bacterium]
MLGLASPTDDAWVEAALADIPRLLSDHAHCEMKAATNALSLAVRYCDRPALVQALAAIAEEETSHFRRVHAMLVERGLPLGTPPVDPYAAELRRSAEVGRGPSALVDRLLVAALIEARSCERFRLLADRCTDPEPRALWRELLASEAGHYRTFLDLAIAEGERDGATADEVRERLSLLAVREAKIVARLAHTDDRATVHG